MTFQCVVYKENRPKMDLNKLELLEFVISDYEEFEDIYLERHVGWTTLS